LESPLSQRKTKQNKTKTNNNKTLWLLTPLLGNNIQACRYFEDIEAFSSVICNNYPDSF